MKHAVCLYALAVLAASPVFAQTSSSSSATPHFAPAPPPPGMNDPGVNPAKAPPAKAETTQGEPASSPAELQPSHLPGKPIPMPRMPGTSATTDANGNSAPDVQVRKEGENTIQEYRENGKVYMIVVTPRVGPQQIYNVDPDGRIQGQNGQPPIKPVQYTIMHWGDSKPASSSSSEDNGS